jgi:hypothetical protein
MSSGDDIQAGRVTTAESTTDLLGAVPSERDVDFNGIVILRVAPQPGDLRPQVTIDGIHGVAHSQGLNFGGTGVVGFGGQSEGTGIAGVGGGVNGGGGIGVLGTGGSFELQPFIGPQPNPRPPGAGVVGQGGRSGHFNTDRLSHGAGVIALAGGSDKPIPPLAVTGGVGVYAQGAEAEASQVDQDGVLIPAGPIAPGPGVLGQGGVPIPSNGPVAAGVIGLAGGTAIPSISESGNSGVYGAGPIGVRGEGSIGPGVLGTSTGGAAGVAGGSTGGVGVAGNSAKAVGGYFASQEAAQIHLDPHPKFLNDPNGQIEGRAGDLLVTQGDESGNATLWFCQKKGNMSWVQVV